MKNFSDCALCGNPHCLAKGGRDVNNGRGGCPLYYPSGTLDVWGEIEL